MADPSLLLTINEAAALARVSELTIRRMIADGRQNRAGGSDPEGVARRIHRRSPRACRGRWVTSGVGGWNSSPPATGPVISAEHPPTPVA